MEFINTFLVPLPPEEAFEVLTDLERVAPCMPGAKLLTREDDVYRGEVRVKVGPMTLTYHGTAEMVEVDEADGSAVIEARGREKRGAGTAAATVRAQLENAEAGTLVTVTTDLDITGKPAQFGRGVMADIGARLIATFADNLVKSLDRVQDDLQTEPSDDETISSVQPRAGSEPETVFDLGSIGGQVVARRSAPVLAVLAVLLFVWLRRRADRTSVR